MQIRIDSADGGKVVEIDVKALDDDKLIFMARMGSSEAQDELKNRTGINPYKDLADVNGQDVDDYIEWLKNNDKKKYNKIVGKDARQAD